MTNRAQLHPVKYFETLAESYRLDISRLGKEYARLSRKIEKVSRERGFPGEDTGTPSIAERFSPKLFRMCHDSRIMAAHIAELSIDYANMQAKIQECRNGNKSHMEFRRTFKALLGRDF